MSFALSLYRIPLPLWDVELRLDVGNYTITAPAPAMNQQREAASQLLSKEVLFCFWMAFLSAEALCVWSVSTESEVRGRRSNKF